jgi:hypothetical protein
MIKIGRALINRWLLLALCVLGGVAHATVLNQIAAVVSTKFVYQYNFAAPGQVPPVISDTRSTTANYYNSSGTITSAAINAGRIDYNPSALTVNGLLSEPAESNYVIQSSALTNGAWTLFNTTLGTDATTAPDGSTAEKLTASAGSAVHRIIETSGILTPLNVNNTFSWYVKAGTNQYVNFNISNSPNNYVATVWNLTGTSTLSPTQTSIGASSGTLVSSYGQYVGGGWFRLSVTATIGGASSLTSQIQHVLAATGNTFSTSGSVTVTAAGTETIYIFGPQAEGNTGVGSLGPPTSYIATTSAAVTRSADSFSATGALIAQLMVGPSIWETTNLVTGVTTRTLYAANAFAFSTGIWYRSFAVYPPGTSTIVLNSRLAVGGPY